MTAPPSSSGRVRGLLCLCGLLAACSQSADRAPRHASIVRPFTVSVTPRGPLQIAEPDSLSDSVRVLSLVPEGDGDGVAFTFADSLHRASAGLGFLDRHRIHAILIWPDSVTAVWWPAPHQLAFTASTGAGVHLVIDVHAPSPVIVADTMHASTVAAATAQPAASEAALHRARAYVDSVRMLAAGAAQHSMLQYGVGRLVPAPGDSMAAFYSVADGPQGGRYNPSWFMMDVRSGEVRPVDRVVGSASAMPSGAGAWDARGDFFYVKDGTLYEARPVR